jgi:hypothetical protein
MWFYYLLQSLQIIFWKSSLQHNKDRLKKQDTYWSQQKQNNMHAHTFTKHLMPTYLNLYNNMLERRTFIKNYHSVKCIGYLWIHKARNGMAVNSTKRSRYFSIWLHPYIKKNSICLDPYKRKHHEDW